MAWFKVDDKLHSHPKRYMAGTKAMGLWLIAGSWCSDQLTDGHVPAAMLTALGGTRADAKALVTAGLWEDVDGGWVFHDWLTQNPSRENVEQQRKKNAEKLTRWREKRRQETGDDVDV